MLLRGQSRTTSRSFDGSQTNETAFSIVFTMTTFMGSRSGYWRRHSWTYLYTAPPAVCWDNLEFPAILGTPSLNIPKSRDIRLSPPTALYRRLLKLAPPTSGGSLAHVADGGSQMKCAAIRSDFSVLSLPPRAGAKRKRPHP